MEQKETMSLSLPLFALAAGAFGIGTTEFAPMGLLPVIAADLHVSIPTAGLLVTGYALGVVVGAPLLTLPTERVPRKWLLLGLMALFTLGNLLSALSPNYAVLLAARVVTRSATAPSSALARWSPKASSRRPSTQARSPGCSWG